MILRANDTVHISSVQSDNLLPGQEFEVDDATAKKLIDRGLATKVKDSKPKAEAEAEGEGDEAKEEPKAPAKASKKKGK